MSILWPRLNPQIIFRNNIYIDSLRMSYSVFASYSDRSPSPLRSIPPLCSPPILLYSTLGLRGIQKVTMLDEQKIKTQSFQTWLPTDTTKWRSESRQAPAQLDAQLRFQKEILSFQIKPWSTAVLLLYSLQFCFQRCSTALSCIIVYTRSEYESFLFT